MKKYKITFKSLVQYLSTIFSWSIFILLLCCAVFLLYYFLSVKVFNKGDSAPPLSIFTIVSQSMIPTIDVYDVILNIEIEDPKDVKVGDVITFTSESSISYDKTVTHRVKDIQIINGEYQYTTKGDNNITEDSAPATYDKLIGKAIIRIPQLGRVQAFVASSFGWISVVIIPALYIIIKDVMKLVKMGNIKKKADAVNAKMVSEKEKVNDNPEKDDIIQANEEKRNDVDES